ncbi:aldehyde dehydrogenase family 9 member A1 [Fistulifera solaris]|uniref:Aldehyde dehydrogenase family 9 member A1 n=1 Tax=Fistulifera solaris TaxID=1519565 RepID=A0A1Z5J825_FISSO|nr:aldehyde dehydrogenase family 9 member A1 [Fistulifera solaris]|eukprot:GAX10096.1 aldehyde dehydrogenase family 9 member A1 [Fistulifera solaris]
MFQTVARTGRKLISRRRLLPALSASIDNNFKASAFPQQFSFLLHYHQKRMVQGVTIANNCIVNTNPANGEIISRVPCTTKEELERTLSASCGAQPQWAATSLTDRIRLLRKGLEAIAAKKDAFVDMIVQEMGKPITEARVEVEGSVSRDEYFRVLQDALEPKKRGKNCQVVRQPLGVVAILSPWNFPVDEILLLALPALASGNAVLVKPSEVTPETGAMVVEALSSVLPPYVVQLAQGDGKIGSQIVAHPLVSMVAMTGSSSTGKKILQTCAASPTIKRLVLELGGKDPMVVFDDADLEQAASDAVTYSLSNTGQVCCSIERVYVALSIYEDFCERVVGHAETFKVGDGRDPTVKVGPMVSSIQLEIVKEHVKDAVEKGAKLLYQSPQMTEGTFHPVTVLSEVTDQMKVYREETFGPIVSLIPFDGTESSATRLANDSQYGLASSVYTKDLVKAERVANSIHAGQVGINCYSIENMDVGCPWVGHKQSGYGYHSGPEGFQQFSVPKSIVFNPK